MLYAPNTVALFLADLDLQDYKYSSINSQLSVISYYFRLAHHPDLRKDALIEKTVVGLKNLDALNGTRQRRPIGKELLHRLILALNSVCSSVFERLIYKLAFSLTFHACLRAGEICKTTTLEHTLRIEQLARETDEPLGVRYTIRFESFKHSNFRTPSITIQKSQDTVICPVISLDDFFRYLPARTGPILQFFDGSVMNRYRLAKKLKEALDFCGEDSSLYNIHSLRIGRATQLANDNISDAAIRSAGRWSSNAYIKYIRPSEFVVPH